MNDPTICFLLRSIDALRALRRLCRRKNRWWGERGSFLITALWGVSLFSLMTASLAFHAAEEILLMKRELAGVKARTDFAAGLNTAATLIEEDPLPHEDSKEKPWFGNISDSIHVEDEESKLNLNHASGTFLAELFEKIEDETRPLKGEKKDYVKVILKLRHEKRIESLEELLLLEDFEKEDWEVLKPYLTVYPELPLININTASPLVLRALIQSLNGDHAAKQILANRLEEARGGNCVFFNNDLTPEAFMERLKLPKTPFVAQVVQEFLAAVTTDSETFRITMKTVGGEEAVGIFRYRVGQVIPEVLFWHEDI